MRSELHRKWMAPRSQVRRRGIPPRSRGVRASRRSRRGRPLADDDGPGPGPGIEPRGIGGLAAVVRGQHQVNWLGLRLGDQLDKAQLIKVAGEQKVSAPMRNVKHQAAGVIRGFGVPVWWRMEHCELCRALVPGCRRGDRAHRDAVSSEPGPEEARLWGSARSRNRGDHNLADLEPVQQIGKAIVMILVGVAKVDRVEPGEAKAPERRGDDPAPTRGSPMRPQS